MHLSTLHNFSRSHSTPRAFYLSLYTNSILLFTVLLTAHHLLYQLGRLYILDLPHKLLSLQTILACFCLASDMDRLHNFFRKINQKAGEKTSSIKVSINFYQLWLISLDTPDSNNIMLQKKHKENKIQFFVWSWNFLIAIFNDWMKLMLELPNTTL